MRVNKTVSFSVVIVLITMLFASVVTVPAAAQSTPPTITSVNPINNMINVPVTKTIDITFNKTVQQGTNYSNIELKKGAISVNTTTTIAGDKLTITPNAPLAYNTSYTVFIPKDAVKNGTETMMSDFTSRFTTVAVPTKGSTLDAPATANATSNVISVTTKMPTALTLTASNPTPTVNQPVTFTATLKNGTTPLSSKSVTIYHYLNSVRYNDTTNATNATGQITVTTSFGSAGTRTYYSTFAGDGSYQSIDEQRCHRERQGTAATVTLTASNTTPAVNQSVTFTATLTSGTTRLLGKNVSIYHYLNGVRYNDTTNTSTHRPDHRHHELWFSRRTHLLRQLRREQLLPGVDKQRRQRQRRRSDEHHLYRIKHDSNRQSVGQLHGHALVVEPRDQPAATCHRQIYTDLAHPQRRAL